MFRKIIITAFLLPVFLELTGCGCSTRVPPPPDVPGVYLDNVVIASEGDEGLKTVELGVVLSPSRSREITVDYRILTFDEVELENLNYFTGNSELLALIEEAEATTDFIPNESGTLVIPAGEVKGNIAFSVIGDEYYEHHDVIIVQLTRADTDIKRDMGVVFIQNDDEPPVVSLTVDDVSELTEQSDSERTLTLSMDVPSGIDTVLGIEWDGLAGATKAIYRGDYSVYDKDDVQLFSTDEIVIPVGSQSAEYTLRVVDDGVDEGEESILIELQALNSSDASIHSTDNMVLLTIPEHTETNNGMQALNDTGVTQNLDIFDATLNAEQDNSYGRDADNSTNSAVDGVSGFHFTKLDANGDPLTDQTIAWDRDDRSKQWSCVRDEVTGLTWEVKRVLEGKFDGISNRIHWYDPDSTSNGGSAGGIGDEDCYDGTCSTYYFQAQRNLQKLCGKTGWRLPTQEELRSLANYGAHGQINNETAIDFNYFPDVTTTYPFWSSTSKLSSNGNTEAYTMKFSSIIVEEPTLKTKATPVVRLVNDQ